MHVGTLVPVVVYFHLFGRAGYSVAGMTHALGVALVVMTAYALLARSQGEMKQFDVGIWILFAVGVVATRAGIAPLVALYQRYSPALVFVALALTALVPLLLGREAFTWYYARRQFPAWQLKTPEFGRVTRVTAAYWGVLFVAAAAIAAAEPTDLRFTLAYPNLLVILLGLSSNYWLPPLYFRLFPPGLPQAVEPLVMGMPLVFDRKAAGDARATIQFCVSGDEPGDYHLRIAAGKCESFTGRAPAPDLTVHTPGPVWMRIARGELDGGRALMEGLYRAEGKLEVLAKLGEWFPVRR